MVPERGQLGSGLALFELTALSAYESMSIMKRIISTLCLITVGLTACNSDRISTLQDVAVAFESLHQQNKLPGFLPNEHGELSTFYIDKRSRSSEWFRQFVASTSKCKSLYLVAVKTGTRRLDYFFCEDSGKLEYFTAFEMKEDAWHENG